MAEVEIKEFDAVRATNFNIKFKNEAKSIKFGCVGNIEGETELRTITKNCEGRPSKKKSLPQKMDLTLSAHILVDVARRIFGLSNKDLKPGVYAYGADSKSDNFALTCDAIDEFEDITKLMSFPNCTSATGLKLTIENGAEELAELELEFEALLDNNRKLYYEAFYDEAEEAVRTHWHENFTPDLVKKVEGGTP